MSAMASQITSLTSVYSTVYSGGDQRKHQSSASLAFVREIHRRPVISPRKGPVTRKMLPFDDVILSLAFFPSQFKFVWFHQYNVNDGYKICIWHDSCAVVVYTKLCCDLMAGNWITVNWSPVKRVKIYITTSSNGNISALLAVCAGNSPVTGEFPAQRPVTRSFDVFFDQRMNKRSSK